MTTHSRQPKRDRVEKFAVEFLEYPVIRGEEVMERCWRCNDALLTLYVARFSLFANGLVGQILGNWTKSFVAQWRKFASIVKMRTHSFERQTEWNRTGVTIVLCIIFFSSLGYISMFASKCTQSCDSKKSAYIFFYWLQNIATTIARMIVRGTEKSMKNFCRLFQSTMIHT